MRLFYNRQCDECESMDIGYDEWKGELFCLHCGLILEERYALISIPQIIEMMKSEEQKKMKELMKDS